MSVAKNANIEAVANAIRKACQEAGYLVSIADRHGLWVKLAYAAIEADCHGS